MSKLFTLSQVIFYDFFSSFHKNFITCFIISLFSTLWKCEQLFRKIIIHLIKKSKVITFEANVLFTTWISVDVSLSFFGIGTMTFISQCVRMRRIDGVEMCRVNYEPIWIGSFERNTFE